jgi:hypothetical protein
MLAVALPRGTDYMIRHLVIMSAAIGLVVGCMFYPYLPGDYDGFAVTLSVMSQLFAMAGLLLVPLGLAWLAYEIRIRSRETEARPRTDFGPWFSWAAIGVATLVAVVVALGSVVDHHFSAGFVALALWAYVATRLAGILKSARRPAKRTFNPAPLYLILLPIVAAAFKFALVGRAAEVSRNRAIDGSAALIRDIERYRDTHGYYPRSLQSLWDDYRPSVKCVERFHYEPNGDFYNVYFEHFAVALDVKEIVMYNKQDEQDFSSHNMDLLQLSTADIDRMRGYVSVHNAGRPHWKYFLFD